MHVGCQVTLLLPISAAVVRLADLGRIQRTPTTFLSHSHLLLLMTITIGSTRASSKISSFLSPISQHAHPHCPSHHSHLHRSCFSVVKQRRSNYCQISGASFSLTLSCRKSLYSDLSMSTMSLPHCSPRLCWFVLFCLSMILTICKTHCWQIDHFCIHASLDRNRMRNFFPRRVPTESLSSLVG